MPVVFRVGAGLVAVIFECVRARAQRDERLARVQIVREVLHLRVRQFPEPQAQHAQISRVQRGDAGHVRLIQRVDGAIGRIEGEHHRALEPVPHRQDLCQHRQPFLRPILLVPGEKNDVLALPRPGLALINHRVRSVRPIGQDQLRQCHDYAQEDALCHARVLPLSLWMTSAVTALSESKPEHLIPKPTPAAPCVPAQTQCPSGFGVRVSFGLRPSRIRNSPATEEH